jgi:hypothetical protein
MICALVLGGLVLGACGASTSSHHSGSASTPGSSSDTQSLAAIVQCFRAHGAPDFPDPVYDPGDGRWHFAISPASVPAATRQACQQLFSASTPSPDLPQAAFQQLVSFAQCMRQHGISDWPDPAPDGTFHLDARLWALGKHGGVYQSMQACHRPSGGIDVVQGS